MGDSQTPLFAFRVWGVIFSTERGATSAEYAILVATVAAVIIVAVAALGNSTLGLFGPVDTFFQTHP
ncbi:MAG: Flp family type IVb pilin [Actinobacteria bacterium]|nr:Flp family type IVb pilin [Propionicimonas sp.]MBU3977310.1 Flp family type IVb pilin [Actinomycetota bacterium]MBU3985820.1 Flp family type IVb pilin [Actinomycetota bacterium]MBU4008605.1 Flp family type IVb pilin [Actinomycetota bacterium]MBU4066245.1 Flp family type IVb pilin [Actinomycetota bacterium]